MSDLTSARLRELIAAATPRPWWGQYEYDGSRTVCQMRSTDTTFCVNMASHVNGKPYQDTKANAELITTLVNNAPALADALDEADLLKWLGESILNGWTFEWNPHQGMFEVLNDEGRYVAGSDQWIDALRAAKEASRGNR